MLKPYLLTHSTGGGLSIKTIEQLQKAQLTHLWLGAAHGWEGGLWLPDAVKHAVKAGYLIAPYDSYETALPPGHQRDWSTTHLGKQVYQQCGIQQANGELKKGFQGKGYYTNPCCVRPTLQQRISCLQLVTGFNSWFLDCYATGMLFDDYRPGAMMTQAVMAEEYIQRMRWTADHHQLVVGSEDGNATTARGLLFARGMQTPVIGWGDTDLQKNPRSPYYLGTWFPDEQPSLFFKTVPLKEPYKTIHFAPSYRLPLYQTVFHDSIIITHHWLFDNLKLNNVVKENTLTQLLYNVPPLFHINRSTLKQRLPQMQHLDQFFKPLHQRLATQALISFDWLTPDGQLQQTKFADGTRLVANFSKKSLDHQDIELPAYSVTALFPEGTVSRYTFSSQ